MGLRNTWGVLLGVVLLSLCVSTPAHADRIADLERRVAQLEAEREQKLVGYDHGFFMRTADDRYLLKVNVLLQPQYEYIAVESEDDINQFRVRRARLILHGNVFDQRLKYRLMPEFADSDGGASTKLLDAYLDWQWFPCFQIQFGQFKVPFTREFIMSATQIQFVDRSLMDAVFTLNRDDGLNLHGAHFDDAVEYAFWVFNGSGVNQLNLNNEVIAGTRLNFHIIGDVGYGQSDLNYSMTPQLGAGLAAAYDFGNADLAANDQLIRFTSDIALHYRGFSLLGVANIVRNTTNNQTDYGFLGQVGYFLVKKHFEVALRGDGVIRDTVGAFRDGPVNTYETGAAFNYYFFGQQVKLQADYNLLWNGNRVQNRNDHQVRLQAQVVF